MSALAIVERLRKRLDKLEFGAPVAVTYQPLDYAGALTRQYLQRFAHPNVPTLLLGMNPGPFGMAQTGVPFGEVRAVKEFLRLTGTVGRPTKEHAKRPILGLECSRSEVSGRRLWGWAERRFGSASEFFEHFFVWNWCPLAFLGASGANLTPDRLPKSEREDLEVECDRSLREMVEWLRPTLVVGVGGFAHKRALAALTGLAVRHGTILHPSPASPAANRGWEATIERQLQELGALPEDRRRP